MKRIRLIAIWIAASFGAAPAFAQVPLIGSSVSANGVPSPAGTSAAYMGWGKNSTGDMDFFAANNGSSPSFYWYFLLGSTLTPEMYLDVSANLHIPNGGVTATNVSGTVEVTTQHYTVGALPSASTAGLGAMVVVTDASTAGIVTPCVGGGSTVMLAVSNGTTWGCH